MQLVGVQRAAVVTARDRWRITWGVSLLGDIAQVYTFGLVSGAQLHAHAEALKDKLFNSGWCFPASQPAVDTEAEAITIDVRLTAGAQGQTVAALLQRLEAMRYGLTLARVARISDTETSAAGVQAREQANTAASTAVGAGAIGAAVGEAAGAGVSWLTGTLKTALIVGVVAAVLFYGAPIKAAGTVARKARRK